MTRHKVLSSSYEETQLLGKTIASQLSPNSVLAIQGDLGAGKTTLIKGIVSSILGLDPATIHSPTFTYLNIYQGSPVFYHFDLYRIRDESDFLKLGFLDYFDAGGICCIEWPEKIQSLLPENALWIRLTYQDATKRVLQWA